MGMTSSRIYLITGDINSGKISFCSNFLRMLPKSAQQKWRIRGILSFPLIHQDEKQGILAVDLESGKKINPNRAVLEFLYIPIPPLKNFRL
jgi:hypothetical protein